MEMTTHTTGWKDYKYGSWLVLVFGKIHCKIVVRQDGVEASDATHFGLIFLPEEVLLFSGTFNEAKDFAEEWLFALLDAATDNLRDTNLTRKYGNPDDLQAIPNGARVYTMADIDAVKGK